MSLMGGRVWSQRTRHDWLLQVMAAVTAAVTVMAVTAVMAVMAVTAVTAVMAVTAAVSAV